MLLDPVNKTMKKPLPSDWDQVASAWDAQAGDKGMWYQRSYIDGVVLGLLGRVRGRRILEIGCGNGYLSRALAQQGARVTGTDGSARMVERALDRERAVPTGARFLHRDAARLAGVPSLSHDAVLSNMCLMDVREAASAIREAGRVLKTGGRLVFSITHPLFSDYQQHWSIQKVGGRQRFGRFVFKYLRPVAERVRMSIGGCPDFMKWEFHRPIGWYLDCLFRHGFTLTAFRELQAIRKVTRARREDGDVTLRRTRYRTRAEKLMKEMAGQEIPLFLVVAADKIRPTP